MRRLMHHFLLGCLTIATFSSCSGKQGQIEDRARTVKMLGMGMLLYADRNSYETPRNICDEHGKPLMSWRVELLPVMECWMYWNQLRRDEPWDSPHNTHVLAQVPPRIFASHPDTPDGHADIMAVTGDPELGFQPARVESESVQLENIADGTISTVVAVQVSPAKSIPWARPGDFVWNNDAPTTDLGASDDDWFHVLMADASVQRISKKESIDNLRKLMGFDNGKAVNLAPVDAP